MRHSIVLAGAILAATLLAACGDAADGADASGSDGGAAIAAPLGAASLAELIGPWRDRPLGLDPVMAGRIAEGCAKDMEGRPGTPPVIIDVRGAGVAMARLSGDRNVIGCSALQITAQGTIEGAGGGWRQDQPEVLGAIGATEVGDVERSHIAGGALTVTGWSVLGRIGPGIASVIVELAGAPPVVATVQNGWFAAWWPTRPGEPSADGLNHPAFIIHGLDIFGNPVAEKRLERGF